MITISLCMIVKNEEDVLDRCLSSVEKAVDEMVIVDTGSADQTRAIAERHHAKIYEFPWIDDFAAARNYAFDQATQDFILWLDADDILPADQLDKLIALKQTLDERCDMVIMQYRTSFDKEGRPTFCFPRERLIRRKAHLRWKGAVHETIPFVPRRYVSDIAIEHHKLHCADPQRNLRILEKLKQAGTMDTRQRYYYARELADHQRYEEALSEYELFLMDPAGWSENKIDACLSMARCWHALKQRQKEFSSLIQAFRYAPPRGEICCGLGRYFFIEKNWECAVFWYQLATTLPLPLDRGGFVNLDCYGYIPWIWLCCCYDQMQKWDEAWQANEKAGALKPIDASYLHNRAYLKQKRESGKA